MEFILSHVEQGVMTITLNRPERLNSFNDVMHQQLSECLKQAERDDAIRCLLITGAGRGFCAGQDLNDRNVDPNGPAPAATPLTAQITGFGSFARRRTSGL